MLNPLALPVSFLFGVIAIVTPFGIGFSAANAVALYFLHRKGYFITYCSVLIGGVVNWLATLLYFQTLTEQQSSIQHIVAVSGFPLRSLLHPTLMRGTTATDPFARWLWPEFYVNFFFWLVVTTLLLRFMPKWCKDKNWRTVLLILYVAVSLMSMGTIVGMYD